MKSTYGDIQLRSSSEKFNLQFSEKPSLAQLSPSNEDSTQPQPTLRFSWESDSARDLEFEFELEAITVDGNKAVVKEKVRTLSFLVKNAAPATYRWRVLAWGQGSNDSISKVLAETEWRKYIVFSGKPIALSLPKNHQTIQYWDKPPPFQFEWNDESYREDEKSTYEFELARDSKFQERLKSVKTDKSKIPTAEFQLTDGTYYWKVKALDRAGNTLRASPIQQVSLNVFPALRAPSSIQPTPGKAFDVIRTEETPVLTWQPMEGATSYEVTVSNGKKQVAQKILNETQFKLEKLPEGHYSWTVRAIDKLNRKGEPSIAKTFSITYGEPLQAPEPTSPEVQ